MAKAPMKTAPKTPSSNKPKKGVLPPGLAAYMAKKKAGK